MKTQEPSVEQRSKDESVQTHPAYAQIGASRISGHAFLYGSDFYHNHYMAITIHASELHRNLSRDWAFSRAEYIEVLLSEAQWAAFVSSPNQGSGTQCTLNHLGNTMIPQLPQQKKRQEQFQREAEETLADGIAGLEKLRGMIDELKMSDKAKKELHSVLGMAQRDLTGSLDFVAKQFGEHIESVTEHAKIEINAYITNAVNRAGLAALQGTSPLEITEE